MAKTTNALKIMHAMVGNDPKAHRLLNNARVNAQVAQLVHDARANGKKQMRKNQSQIEHEVSSGNVFADLGVANPQEALAKAQLARAICLLIEKEGATQAAVAERLGVDQPKVSALVRGRLKDFSTDRLLHFLLKLGHDVKINVQSKKAATAHANLQVALV